MRIWTSVEVFLDNFVAELYGYGVMAWSQNERSVGLALLSLLQGSEDKLHIDKSLQDPEAMALSFRESFKQREVTGNPELDFAIWNLIDASPVFWRAWRKTFN